MHTSKKYKKRAEALWGQGDFVLCDAPILTKHAKRRCDERHIKRIHVMGDRAHAIVKDGNVVVTVWQKPPDGYGVRSSKGIEYMRKTHKAVQIPKEVLKHFPRHASKKTEEVEAVTPRRKTRPRKGARGTKRDKAMKEKNAKIESKKTVRKKTESGKSGKSFKKARKKGKKVKF